MLRRCHERHYTNKLMYDSSIREPYNSDVNIPTAKNGTNGILVSFDAFFLINNPTAYIPPTNEVITNATIIPLGPNINPDTNVNLTSPKPIPPVKNANRKYGTDIITEPITLSRNIGGLMTISKTPIINRDI